MDVLTLKIKVSVILPARWVYSGIMEKCIQDKHAVAKPEASPTNEGWYFMEKKVEVRGTCFEGKPIQKKQKFKVMMVSHWPNRRGSQFLVGDAMHVFFLLGPVIDYPFLLRILLLRCVIDTSVGVYN